MNNTLSSQAPSPSSRKTASRGGFTLLELLIVIGIIGILASVSIAQFAGATSSAKATTCMTNMRNISVAINNVAMNNDDGIYPGAGSFKFLWFRDGSMRYPTRVGWVGWSRPEREETTEACGSPIPFSSGNKDLVRMALTNGAIWRAIGGSVKSYRCPVHANACYKRNGRYPGWSYAMNKDFGWDENNGGGPIESGYKEKRLGKIQNADRMLLLCEIQGVDNAVLGLHANVDGSGSEGDGVLQYEKENIGFNHQITGKRWVAHVAYADGHVGRLMYPRGGMSLDELTKALCLGHELQFDGNGYQDLSK